MILLFRSLVVVIALFPVLVCVGQNEGFSNSLRYKNPNVSNSLILKLISVQAYSNSLQISTKSLSNEVKAPNALNLETKTTAQMETTKTETTQKLARELGLGSYPKYYALLIGNSDYKRSDENLPNLRNPTNDALKFYDVLLKYSFAKENIRLMKNASRSDMIDALEELAAKLTEKDNLLIFYAGHGSWDENLRVGYWLPSDAVPGKKASWFSNSNLKDYIAGIKSKHILLISDACFSGSIFRARAVSDPLSDIGVAKLYKYPSRKAMTSGNLNTTPDESKFFEYLNKRLTENDRHFISAKEIFYSMFNAVVNNTNSIPQYGVIQETGDEGGDFIFIRKE